MKHIRLAGSAVIVLMGIMVGTSGIAHAQTDMTYRWGADGDGVGGAHEVNKPTAIVGLGDVTAIDAGNATGMALANGTVYVWGDNDTDTLTSAYPAYESSAVPVAGLPPIVSIGEDNDTDVAIDASGNAYGWGANSDGQLCTGTTTQVNTPVLLASLGADVVSVQGAAKHFDFLLSNDSLVGCGQNNYGQLGNGTTANSSTPVAVVGLPASPITAITAGPYVSSVLLANGQVWSWGANTNGELGDGNKVASDVPVQVHLPSAAVQVSDGGSLVPGQNGGGVALLASGVVYAWGSDSHGQVGNDATQTAVTTPVLAFVAPSNIAMVLEGAATVIALDSGGNVWSWGSNVEGEIGNGGSSGNRLTAFEALTGVDLISTTAGNVLAHTP